MHPNHLQNEALQICGTWMPILAAAIPSVKALPWLPYVQVAGIMVGMAAGVMSILAAWYSIHDSRLKIAWKIKQQRREEEQFKKMDDEKPTGEASK